MPAARPLLPASQPVTHALSPRQTIYAVPQTPPNPVPIWVFIIVSCTVVVLLALAALLCCRLTRRTPPTPPVFPPRDPEVQRWRGLLGYYEPRRAMETRQPSSKEGGRRDGAKGGKRLDKVKGRESNGKEKESKGKERDGVVIRVFYEPPSLAAGAGGTETGLA